MRKTSGFVLVAVLALAFSSACGGSTTSPSPQSSSTPTPTPTPTPAPSSPTLPNGSMTATVDGSHWSATGFLTVQYQPNIAPFVIIGSDSVDTNNNSTRMVTLATPGYHTGTFVACPQSSCAFLSTLINGHLWSAGPIGGSGTIVVSTMTDHNVVGTFSFIGVDQNGANAKSVTNGAFNIKY